MNFVYHLPARPADWPAPSSRTARALGWLHFVLSVAMSCLIALIGTACYAAAALAGFACGVVVLLAAIPLVALVLLGWVLRSLARRVLPPC